jgi:hypothetical protein
MTDKLPPPETVLIQSIAKAQMCQDIFRHIMNDKSMTRLQIMDYILSESVALTTLSEEMLKSLQQDQALQLAAKRKILEAAEKSLQDAQSQQVTDTEIS